MSPWSPGRSKHRPTRTARPAAILGLALAMASCTHDYVLNPALGELPTVPGPRNPSPIAWAPSPAQGELEVIHDGPGGDKLSLHPYADLTVGIDAVLAEHFETVVDPSFPHVLVFEVQLLTNPSWGNGLLWPPTSFAIHGTARILGHPSGEVLWSEQVRGLGSTDSASLGSAPFAAGERAATHFLAELSKALGSAHPSLGTGTSDPRVPGSNGGP